MPPAPPGATVIDPGSEPTRYPTGIRGFVDDDDVGHDSFEEGPVVAHDDHGPRPVVEEVLEGAERVEVEVVGRLVEQQDIRVLGEHEHQLQPPSFASGKLGDRRVLGCGVEPEPFEQRLVPPIGGAGTAGEGIDEPMVGIEIDAELVEVAEAHRRAVFDGAGCRRRPPSHGVEQGRLARAVRSDDAEALVGVQRKGESLDQASSARLDADVFELDHPVPESRCVGVKHQRVVAQGATGVGGLELLRPTDVGLGLAGACRGAAQQPLTLASGEIAAHGFGALVGSLTLFSGLEVGAVTPVVDVESALVDLEHAGRDRVEQVAVVGDAQEATGERGESFLEPVDRVDVEMIGRFVEDEQIGRRDQGLGQRDPALLPAAQRRDGLLEPTAETETVEHGRGFPRIAYCLERGRFSDPGTLQQ